SRRDSRSLPRNARPARWRGGSSSGYLRNPGTASAIPETAGAGAAGGGKRRGGGGGGTSRGVGSSSPPFRVEVLDHPDRRLDSMAGEPAQTDAQSRQRNPARAVVDRRHRHRGGIDDVPETIGEQVPEQVVHRRLSGRHRPAGGVAGLWGGLSERRRRGRSRGGGR